MIKKEHRKEFIAGLVLLAGAVALILAVFSWLSHTDRTSIYLWESEGTRAGWRYETLSDGKVTEVEPVFPDEFSSYIPGQAVEALRMSRTMTESLSGPDTSAYGTMLELEPYDTRVEVFMDSELLLTDFHGLERDETGFVSLTDQERAAMEPEYRKLTVLLPEDYIGRTLTINIYFAEPRQDPMPLYPTLSTEQMDYASFVVTAVPEAARMTGCAILAVAILVPFLLDTGNGEPDRRSLLLALYFLLLFLDEAYGSTAAPVSLLYQRMNLSFLTDLYMTPLYLYLAMYFRGWKRAALSAAAVAWAVLEGIQMFRAVQRGEVGVTLTRGGMNAYFLILIFAAAFLLEYIFRWRKKRGGGPSKGYVVLAAAVLLGELLYGARQWGNTAAQVSLAAYVRMLARSAMPLPREYPDYFIAVHFITRSCSVVSVCVLVIEFFRRTVYERRTIGVLEERSRQTMEGYERMLRAQEATGAVRHEMRHHMTALAGFLDSGETERAREYIADLSDGLDRLPAGQYSRNILVNVIAGAYLDRAKAEGIRVESSLTVPPELPVADEDLSVFLTNMLENALHACQRLGPDRDRYIRARMYVHENFLFISCANSAPDEQEETARTAETAGPRQHGYGLEAMRRIAEKYDSILKVDRSAEEFVVTSYLRMGPGED